MYEFPRNMTAILIPHSRISHYTMSILFRNHLIKYAEFLLLHLLLDLLHHHQAMEDSGYHKIVTMTRIAGSHIVTVDPVTSKKAPQSVQQKERESAQSVTNSESRSKSRRKDSHVPRRSPGHHAT